MPFDSNGTFNRLRSWKSDAAASVKIRSDFHDDEDDGFAAGLSTCITKDGRTQPVADIPMNQKKLVNLGEPNNPTDAATKNYVDNFKSFTTGANISGAGPINGFINFTSPTGVNGIGWTTADMSWIGRVEEASKTRKRLAVNDKKDGTGTDVCIVDEGGIINNSGNLTNNLSYENAEWRTIAAGKGTLLNYAGGVFNVYTNDTATTVGYQSATMREFLRADGSTGTTSLTLDKSASGKAVHIIGSMAAKYRWQMDLGNTTAETGTDRVGSDFVLYSYNNAGAGLFAELSINRATHQVTTGGSIAVNGIVSFSGALESSTQTSILAAQSGGSIYLRPYGYNNSTNQMILSPTSLSLAPNIGFYAGLGIWGRAGTGAGYGANVMNFNYSGGFVYSYVDATLMGAITWQSDYRIKRNIQPLPTMWNRVKALNPVRYQHGAFKDLVKNEDTVRWGLIAHEVQDALVKSAAIGDKDEDNVIQSLNPLTLIAVLTKALQEAMERIEALEAAA